MARLVMLVWLACGLALTLACSGTAPEPAPPPKTGAGNEAFAKRDYDAAAEELRPQAEAGDAAAQTKLGFMYTHGQGVDIDPVEGARWYRMAAEQGHAEAQYNLGLDYDLGRGTEQDIVQAHVWFTLAAAQGYNAARQMRDDTAERMTVDQMKQARELAAEWSREHEKKTGRTKEKS